MIKAPAIVHVGYPKCASTTIQYHFFARQPNVLFVSRKGNAGDERYWELYDRMSMALTKGTRIPHVTSGWRKAIKANQDREAFIFSDERITLPVRHSQFTSMLERPELIGKVFGAVRIVLVLRQPLNYLRSLYQQMGVNRFKKDRALPPLFEDWLDQDIAAAKHQAGATSQGLCFGDLAARYSEVFGKQNVGIFFLEDLQASPESFFQSLGRFMGLPSPVIPDVSRGDNKNVTSEKKTMLKIAEKVPSFGEPVFPEAFLAQAIPFVRAQADYLKKQLGVDALKRWPALL